MRSIASSADTVVRRTDSLHRTGIDAKPLGDLAHARPSRSTCHALYHRGTISADSIYAYKAMLVALSNAFDREAIDRLLFLAQAPKDFLICSGDGVLQFSRLLAAGFATVEMKSNNNWQIVTYAVISARRGGTSLVHGKAEIEPRSGEFWERSVRAKQAA
jgi:hypothetical protein